MLGLFGAELYHGHLGKEKRIQLQQKHYDACILYVYPFSKPPLHTQIWHDGDLILRLCHSICGFWVLNSDPHPNDANCFRVTINLCDSPTQFLL